MRAIDGSHRYTHGLLETRKSVFRDHAQARAIARVFSSTTNVVLFEQGLVTRLVFFLDVIQKRTARRD